MCRPCTCVTWQVRDVFSDLVDTTAVEDDSEEALTRRVRIN
jgi:FPC/CPF motif-containing protein YcgG